MQKIKPANQCFTVFDTTKSSTEETNIRKKILNTSVQRNLLKLDKKRKNKVMKQRQDENVWFRIIADDKGAYC